MAARLATRTITLPQGNALALGKGDQLHKRPMHQACVGRMRHRLRLHGRVDHHALEVLVLERAGLVRHRQALLDQGGELLLAQSLAPARHRTAIEGGLVAEAQFAAEILVIGVLHPALVQHLVGEVLHVLEDEEAGDQPRRQAWLTGACRAHRREPAIEKLPVDLLRQQHQRVLQVDDLIELRPQQIGLPIVTRSCHHAISPNRRRRHRGIKSSTAQNRNPKTQESEPHRPAFLQIRILGPADLSNPISGFLILHDNRLDPSLEDASMLLGSSRLGTFRRIVLPLLVPGVLAGAFLIFVQSLDNVSMTLFLAPPGTSVLPLRMYAMLEQELDPRIAAISGVLIIVSLVALVAVQRLAPLLRVPE